MELGEEEIDDSQEPLEIILNFPLAMVYYSEIFSNSYILPSLKFHNCMS